MRISRLLMVGAAAVAAAGLAASPAMAQPTDDTAATFEVAAGTLDIAAPAAADLGSGASGDALLAPLGVVTVDDSRGAADSSWAATVTSTSFQTGGGSATETVLPAEIEYWSGAATATTGTGTFTPGQATVAAEAPLDAVTPLAAFTHTGGTGGNTASWNPGMTVNLPLDSVAGVYTGTVTHSVA